MLYRHLPITLVEFHSHQNKLAQNVYPNVKTPRGHHHVVHQPARYVEGQPSSHIRKHFLPSPPSVPPPPTNYLVELCVSLTILTPVVGNR